MPTNNPASSIDFPIDVKLRSNKVIVPIIKFLFVFWMDIQDVTSALCILNSCAQPISLQDFLALAIDITSRFRTSKVKSCRELCDGLRQLLSLMQIQLRSVAAHGKSVSSIVVQFAVPFNVDVCVPAASVTEIVAGSAPAGCAVNGLNCTSMLQVALGARVTLATSWPPVAGPHVESSRTTV
jgi:hypothetical protein